MSLRLSPEASAALRRAGSRALPRGPRAVLLRRLRRYGFDPERQNIGGIRSGARGSGDALAAFPDLDAAARRLVELCRILAGEHVFAAVQGFDMDAAFEGGGTFFSLAPEHGARPLEIAHWSGLMPGDRSGDPGSPGYEVGGVDEASGDRPELFRDADGTIRTARGGWSVARGPRVPRPAAYHVILARHARERASRLPALAAGPSTAPALALDLQIDLAGLEGLFGPSDAAAHAFSDLAASWKAIEAAPGASKLPGWKMNHAAWLEFARAWKAGDDASPQCSGDCESGLRGQILTLQTMRDDADKILPGWSKKVARDLSLDAAKGGLWSAAEKGLEAVDRGAPAIGWLGLFLAGRAPRWQYGIAAGGVVLVAGSVVRSYLPRGSRSG